MKTKANEKRGKAREEMRAEFIHAALQLIEEQGVEALSTRNLSKITGYSYATLYNHFPNISALFQYCIHEHILWLNDYLSKYPSPPDWNPSDHIKQLAKLVSEYFLMNPKSFELLFMVRVSENPPLDIRESLLEPPAIQMLRKSLFDYFIKLSLQNIEEYEQIFQIVLSHLIGRLLLYFRRTSHQDNELFKASFEKEVEWLLQAIECSIKPA